MTMTLSELFAGAKDALAANEWYHEDLDAALALHDAGETAKRLGKPLDDDGDTLDLSATATWDESKHPRDHGKFTSGVSHDGATATADPPAPSPSRLEKLKGSKVGRVAGKAAEKYRRLMETRAGRVWHKIEHALTTGMRYTQRLALQAARERDLPEDHVERIGRVMAVVDYAGTFGTAPLLGVAGSVFGPVGVIAGKTVGSAAPSASVVYLAYSTARNPMATLRAAKKLIQGQLPGLPERKKHGAAAELSGGFDPYSVLAERFHEHDGDDLYEALLYAALDETQDVAEAIRMADDAYAADCECEPEDEDCECDEDEEAEEDEDDLDLSRTLDLDWVATGRTNSKGLPGWKNVTPGQKTQYRYQATKPGTGRQKKAAPEGGTTTPATPDAAPTPAAAKPEPAPAPTPLSVDDAHTKLQAGELSIQDIAALPRKAGWKKEQWQQLAVKLGQKKTGTIAQHQERIRAALAPKEGKPPVAARLNQLADVAAKGEAAGEKDRAVVREFVADHPELAGIMREVHAANPEPEPAATRPAGPPPASEPGSANELSGSTANGRPLVPEAEAHEHKARYNPSLPDTTRPADLTPDERNSLMHYVYEGAFAINRGLRDGTTLSDRDERVVEHIDAYMGRLGRAEKPFRVSRGIKVGNARVRDVLRQYWDAFMSGESVVFNDYLSTSTNSPENDPFGFNTGEITYDIAGVRGADLRVLDPSWDKDHSEFRALSEVLFPRGSRFKIEGVDEHKGDDGQFRYTVRMSQIV